MRAAILGMAALVFHLGVSRVDDADWAQAMDQIFTDAALARHHQRRERLPLSHFCKGCGEEIPERRRAAMPGARMCVDCQAEVEEACR